MVSGETVLNKTESSIANIKGIRAFLKKSKHYKYWHGIAEIMYSQLKADFKEIDGLRFIGRCIGERSFSDDDFNVIISHRCNGDIKCASAKEMRDILGYCILENGVH